MSEASRGGGQRPAGPSRHPEPNRLNPRQILGVLRHLRRQEGDRLARILLIQTVVGVLTGMGLLLLIALLGLLDERARAGQSSVRGLISGAYDAIGLPHNLTAVVLSFAALVVFTSVLLARQQVMVARVETRFGADLRRELLASAHRADWSAVRTYAADIRSLLTSGVRESGQLAVAVLNLTAACLVLLVYVLVALRLSPLVTVVTLAVGAVLFGIARRDRERHPEGGPPTAGEGRQSRRSAQLSLEGLKLSRLLASDVSEDYELPDDVDTDDRKVERARARSRTQMIFGIGGAVAIGFGLWLAAGVADLPTPELIVLVVIFYRVTPRIQAILRFSQQAARHFPQYLEVTGVIVSLRQHAADQIDAPPLPVDAPLRLSHATFRYETSGYDALSDVTVAVPAHRVTAVVGRSGAGKSTLVDLLTGLLPPDEGTLDLGGRELDTVGRAGLRRSVAYMPQDTQLFPGTVRDNILFGRDRTDEEIAEALDAAAASRLIQRLPRGLDTQVVGNGANLSVGERQRVALARALLVAPQLLVLDEPTSSLDPMATRAITNAISALRGHVTVIVVSHGRRLLQVADHIIVLDEGRVVTSGSLDELSRHPDDSVRLLVTDTDDGQSLIPAPRPLEREDRPPE